MTPHSAQKAGEEKNTLIQGHMVTCQNFPELTALICRWTYLHCRTWVCLPWATNGLNDEAQCWRVNLRTFPHAFSEAVGLEKNMSSWWKPLFWGVVGQCHILICQNNNSKQLHFSQQHGRSSSKDSHHCTRAAQPPTHGLQRSFSAIKGSVHSHSQPNQQNWWKPSGLCRWWWPGIGRNSGSFAVGWESRVV